MENFKYLGYKFTKYTYIRKYNLYKHDQIVEMIKKKIQKGKTYKNEYLFFFL